MQSTLICLFLSCAFINFIFVFLTSGQYCNSGMQKRIHFRTDMEHNICRPVNNSDVSLGYQFCKNIIFILYIIYDVRYNNICYSAITQGDIPGLGSIFLEAQHIYTLSDSWITDILRIYYGFNLFFLNTTSNCIK